MGGPFFHGESPMIAYFSKYIYILIVITIIIFLIFAFQMKKGKNFGDNITLSNLTFEGNMGHENLSEDPTRPTIIIWFHPECENCQYQLKIIDGNIERLAEARFFFITADTNFFINKYASKWPDLVQSKHVFFGIIKKSRFIDEFGPVVTPSLLIFNRMGVLKEKLYGEVKLEKILSENQEELCTKMSSRKN